MKIKSQVLLLIFFSSAHFVLHAQNSGVDSLKRLLKRPDDTTKVNVLNNICWEMRNSFPDEAAAYGRDALKLAKKLSYSNGLVRAYNRLGVILMNQGIYDTAKNYYQAAVVIADEAKNKTGKASSLMNLGNIAYFQSDYYTAIDYFLKASDIYQEIKDPSGVANCLLNTGSIYFFLGKYDTTLLYQSKGLAVYREMNMKMEEAMCLDNIGATYSTKGEFTKSLQSHFEALKIFDSLGNKRQTANTLGNIGGVYSDQKNFEEALVYFRKAILLHNEMNNHHDKILVQTNIGSAYHSLKKPDSALIYYQQSLAEAKAINAEDLAAMAEQGIGLILYQKKDFDGALHNYQHAEAIFRKLGNKDALMSVLNNLAGLHSEMGHDKEALAFAKEGFEEAKISGSALKLQTANFALSEVYKRKKEFAQALVYYEDAVKIKDSLFNESKSREIGRLESAHQLDTKDKEISLLNKDKQIQEEKSQRQKIIRNSLMGVLALILLLAFVLIRNNRQKQKTNLLLVSKNIEIESERDKVEQALTDLKSTQSQLIQREKMASLGELTAGIAHEIQNPLNFINNFSDVNQEMADELKAELQSGNIEEAIKISASIKDNEARINQHGKRADAIAKSMMQHSRPNAGQKELTDINHLADEYLLLSYRGFNAKAKELHAGQAEFNAELKIDLDTSIGKINIIPQDIGRVLLNLFNNAFYSVAEKKRKLGEDYTAIVELQTIRNKNNIEIIVRDNGTGIPEKVRDKIFQPFFTTKPAGQGTGLGLSLSYDIVKAHGGEISLDSGNDGAKFLISLPVA